MKVARAWHILRTSRHTKDGVRPGRRQKRRKLAQAVRVWKRVIASETDFDPDELCKRLYKTRLVTL